MKNRPLSPHLQIYKLPLAAIISIAHRIVGGVILGAAVVLAILCIFDFFRINLDWAENLIFSPLGKIIAMGLVTSVIFYALAETRYILWGCNVGVTPMFAKASNGVIITLTIVFSLICWLCIWS